jgi:hypothetical protein
MNAVQFGDGSQACHRRLAEFEVVGTKVTYDAVRGEDAMVASGQLLDVRHPSRVEQLCADASKTPTHRSNPRGTQAGNPRQDVGGGGGSHRPLTAKVAAKLWLRWRWL